MMYSLKVKTSILKQLLLICGVNVLGSLSMSHDTAGTAAGSVGNDGQPLPYILVTTYNSIYRIYPWPYSSSTSQELLVSEEYGGIQGIGYHYKLGRIYWTNTDARLIRTAQLDGTNVSTLVSSSLGFPADLSVDWINDNLYWTDRMMKRIEGYNLITGRRRTVVNTGQKSLPFGIIVYPYPGNGWVYWTDLYHGQIKRVSISGDGQEVIAGTLGSRCIQPITLDYFAQVVYWVDNCDFSIRSVTITGNQLSIPSNNRFSSLGVTLYEDIIYWSGSAYVYGVNKTTRTNATLIITGTTSNPFKTLKVVHPNNQPNGETFVEKIADSIPIDDYNSSCPPSCMNGQCIPPGLCACAKGWSGVLCNIDNLSSTPTYLYTTNLLSTPTASGGPITTPTYQSIQLAHTQVARSTLLENTPHLAITSLTVSSVQISALPIPLHSTNTYITSLAAPTIYTSVPITTTPDISQTNSILTDPQTATLDMFTSTMFAVGIHSSSITELTHTSDVMTSSIPFTSQSLTLSSFRVTSTNVIPTTPTTTTEAIMSSQYIKSIHSLQPTSTSQDVAVTSVHSMSSISQYVTTSSSQSTEQTVTPSQILTTPPDLATVDSLPLVATVTGAVAGGTCLIIILVIALVTAVGCYIKHTRSGSYTLEHLQFHVEVKPMMNSDPKLSTSSNNSRTSFGINGTCSDSPCSKSS